VAALTGCSAGQVASTTAVQPSISGLNTQSPDGSLLIRNLQVVYTGPTGYPAGGTAPVEVSLFNETTQPMTVVISSVPQAGSVSARQIGLTGGAAAESPSRNPEPSGGGPAPDPNPSASEVIDASGQPTTPPVPGASLVPSAAAAPAQPARLTIPGLSSAVFRPTTDGKLLAAGLSAPLRPGGSLSLVFEVSTGPQPLTVRAPMEIPLSPASRAPGIPPNKNLGGD